MGDLVCARPTVTSASRWRPRSLRPGRRWLRWRNGPSRAATTPAPGRTSSTPTPTCAPPWTCWSRRRVRAVLVQPKLWRYGITRRTIPGFPRLRRSKAGHPLLVTDLAAQHAENRTHRCSRIDVGSAGENVDVSELVFGPGRHGDVRFAEDQDACRSVGLERLNQLGAHGAAEQARGFPHSGHDLFRRWCGVSASGYVEDCMDHRLAVLGNPPLPHSGDSGLDKATDVADGVGPVQSPRFSGPPGDFGPNNVEDPLAAFGKENI